MRLIFLDDSAQSAPPRQGLGELIAIGGVVVPHDQVTQYAADLCRIKRDCGIPDGEEIEWKAPKGTVQSKAGGPATVALRRQMLESAARLGIKSIVVVVDHGRVYKSKSVPEIGQEILGWFYDKANILLDTNEDTAVIVADKPGGGSAEESRWLTAALTLTNDGTTYSKPGRVILPILTAGSHHVPHLQLADLVVAATTAAVAGRKSGLDLLPELRALQHRNTSGYAGGAGLTLWPREELSDLHYWLFQEDVYWKSGVGHLLGPTASSGPFHPPGRPYIDNDGLPGVEPDNRR